MTAAERVSACVCDCLYSVAGGSGGGGGGVGWWWGGLVWGVCSWRWGVDVSAERYEESGGNLSTCFQGNTGLKKHGLLVFVCVCVFSTLNWPQARYCTFNDS